jgi:hypothetical protein
LANLKKLLVLLAGREDYDWLMSNIDDFQLAGREEYYNWVMSRNDHDCLAGK